MPKPFEDCNVVIYTENRRLTSEDDGQYDQHRSLLLATRMLYVVKINNNNKILIGLSGVTCLKGSKDFNGYFFCSSPPKNNFLLNFFTSLENKCQKEGLTINDKDVKEFFRNKKNADISYLKDNIGVIKKITGTPSFCISKEMACDAIEKTIIELDKIKSVGFNFSTKEIKDIPLDILYSHGHASEIKPTPKTEERITEIQIQQQTQKEEEHISNIKEKIKQTLENSLRSDLETEFRSIADGLKNGFCPPDIKYIKNQIDETSNKSISEFKKELLEKFNTPEKTKKFAKFHSNIRSEIDNYRPRDSNLETICQNIIKIIDIQFEKFYRQEPKHPSEEPPTYTKPVPSGRSRGNILIYFLIHLLIFSLVIFWLELIILSFIYTSLPDVVNNPFISRFSNIKFHLLIVIPIIIAIIISFIFYNKINNIFHYIVDIIYKKFEEKKKAHIVASALPKTSEPKSSFVPNFIIILLVFIAVVIYIVVIYMVLSSPPYNTAQIAPPATITPTAGIYPNAKQISFNEESFRDDRFPEKNLYTMNLNLTAGDTILWINSASKPLTLVNKENSEKIKIDANDKNYTPFSKTGTYNFYLEENQSLSISIIVES